NGVPATDQRLRNAVKYVRDNARSSTDTYSVSLSTVVLTRVGYREDRSLIRALAAKIMAGQQMTGGWTYTLPVLRSEQERDIGLLPPRGTAMGDLSLTQFAVLALWQAQRVGSDVRGSMQAVRQRLAWAQTKDGGWNYHGLPDTIDTNTMTTAGAYMWVLSSASEIQQARKRGDQIVLPREPLRARTNTPGLSTPRSALAKKKAKDGTEKTEEKKAVPEDRPVDLYDALAKSSIATKEVLYNTAVEAAKKANQPEPPEPEYTVTQAKLPPPINAAQPNPLQNDQPFLLSLDRVGVHADLNIANGSLYYLWSIERLGVLLGATNFGKTDWFETGGAALLTRQNMDGSWGVDGDFEGKPPTPEMLKDPEYGPKNNADTSFALLFLKKANLGSDVARYIKPEQTHPFIVTAHPEKERYIVADAQQEAKFTTLALAVAAAKSGETILIRGDGPYPVGGLSVDKPLTIRAAHGFTPVFKYGRPVDKLGVEIDIRKSADARCMLIVKADKVTLEGVRVQLETPLSETAEWCAIRSDGKSLRMLNCTISEARPRGSIALELVDAPRVFLRNCQFTGFKTTFAVKSSKVTNIALKDTIVYGPKFIQAVGAGELNLWLVESTLNCEKALDFQDLAGAANVVAENNAIRVAELVANYGRGERTWTGQYNLFDAKLWVAKGPANGMAIDDLNKWKRFWSSEEPRSRVLQAPFQVTRLQMGPFTHDHSSQEWSMDDDKLRIGMTLRPETQIGANVFVVGAGLGYLQFSEQPGYQDWLQLDLPSERPELETTASLGASN
ncbi:MAG: hypothetical protein ACRDD1_03295, partial [Planctomycetia bacterium]